MLSPQRVEIRDFFHDLCDRIADTASDRHETITADEIDRWPSGFLEPFLKGGLIKKSRRAERIECRGCAERCSRPIEQLPSPTPLPPRWGVTCDLRDDISWLSVHSRRLQRWRTNPQFLVAFVASELNRPLPPNIEVPGFVQLGTFMGSRNRRAIALRFGDTTEFLLGDESFELADLLQRDGGRLKLDLEKIRLMVDTASETVVGGKRYRPSRLNQQRKKAKTAQRDLRLQDAADILKQQHPGWPKPKIAQAIFDSGDFLDVSAKRITRIIRVVKNRRRKKFA